MNTAFNFILWKFHLRSIFFRQYCTSGLNLCDDWQPLVVSVESVLDQSRWFFFLHVSSLTYLTEVQRNTVASVGLTTHTHSRLFGGKAGYIRGRLCEEDWFDPPLGLVSTHEQTDRQNQSLVCVALTLFH